MLIGSPNCIYDYFVIKLTYKNIFGNTVGKDCGIFCVFVMAKTVCLSLWPYFCWGYGSCTGKHFSRPSGFAY